MAKFGNRVNKAIPLDTLSGYSDDLGKNADRNATNFMLMVASTESLRRQNRALVLSTLRERGPLAHTDISEWTNLSSATVSSITTDLLNEHAIKKIEAVASSGRGRPKVLFQHNPDAAYVAVICISSEFVECSLADYAGTLKDRFEEKRPPNETDAHAFAIRFKASLERLLERSGLSRDKIKTISITSKGLTAPGRPVLLWSPIFGDQTLDFEELLKPEWNTRILLTNETQFAAQASAIQRKLNDPVYSQRHSATLSLGHNIGLGVATERPGQRVQSIAPAFGHMMHTIDGPLCRCGANGCIEAFAGFYGILRSAFEVPSNTIPAKFVPLVEMDKIADAARNGDRMAEFAFRQAGEVLGIGMSRLHSLYGPMPITVTGPGVKYWDLMKSSFEAPLHQNLQVRHGQMPKITIEENQSQLIFEGHVSTCLSDLDADVISARPIEKSRDE